MLYELFDTFGWFFGFWFCSRFCGWLFGWFFGHSISVTGLSLKTKTTPSEVVLYNLADLSTYEFLRHSLLAMTDSANYR